jgi:hypothetical protein
VESCIAIGPGIEVPGCPCQGAPRAVFPDALLEYLKKLHVSMY